MDLIRKTAQELFEKAPFDALAVGVIDFSGKAFTHFELSKVPGENFYFDLASVTKVLTNSLSYFLGPEAFDEKMLLCLSHRGGLPAWGLLPKHGWEEIISSYQVKKSPTLYSDYSALRVLVELSRKGVDQRQLCRSVWDREVCHWTELPDPAPLLQFGFVDGEPNFGKVHDPNARVIEKFCSHAGLFGTIEGVCRTLLNYQERTQFVGKVKEDLKQHSERFSYGWDRVVNPSETLAGPGCGPLTFGHLGFTGTSVWIDPEQMKGHVILSNATRDYWFSKNELNEIRRKVGSLIWQKI